MNRGATAIICATLLSLLIFPFINLSNAQPVRAIGSPYTSRNQMMQQWFELENQHPNVITHEQIGSSVQGNPLYVFRIGNPEGAAVMWDGSVHGCEDTGTESTYWFTNWLVNNDSQTAKDILSKNYFLVIPYINYDRYNGRTNMNNVNLARNFVYNWGHSGSSDPTSQDYRGPYAASEPETQAVRYAIMTYNPKVYVNVHTGLHTISYVGKNSSITDIGLKIKEIYEANLALKGAPPEYNITGHRSGGSGYVYSDAYDNGACAFLFETQTWETLPITLDEWHTQYYPSVEAVIIATLEAAQIDLTQPDPNPPTNTVPPSSYQNPIPTPNPTPPKQTSIPKQTIEETPPNPTIIPQPSLNDSAISNSSQTPIPNESDPKLQMLTTTTTTVIAVIVFFGNFVLSRKIKKPANPKKTL
jgi:hypothetical protein